MRERGETWSTCKTAGGDTTGAVDCFILKPVKGKNDVINDCLRYGESFPYALSLSARRSQLNDPYDRSPVFISSPIHHTSHVSTYITHPPPPPHTTAPELRTVSHFYLRKTRVLPLTDLIR